MGGLTRAQAPPTELGLRSLAPGSLVEQGWVWTILVLRRSRTAYWHVQQQQCTVP